MQLRFGEAAQEVAGGFAHLSSLISIAHGNEQPERSYGSLRLT
jgi:hypothetical protein